MSWSFRKAGKDKEALKLAVQKESAPFPLLARICSQIDGIELQPGQIIVVASHGHHEHPEQKQPVYGKSTEETHVAVVSFYEPLA